MSGVDNCFPSFHTSLAVTLALVAAVAEVDAQAKALEARIVEQLGRHPDRVVFTSLPRAGRVRALRFLLS